MKWFYLVTGLLISGIPHLLFEGKYFEAMMIFVALTCVSVFFIVTVSEYYQKRLNETK